MPFKAGLLDLSADLTNLFIRNINSQRRDDECKQRGKLWNI